MVKRLRHRPFTAVTRVRFPVGSPTQEQQKCCSFSLLEFQWIRLFSNDFRHYVLEVDYLLNQHTIFLQHALTRTETHREKWKKCGNVSRSTTGGGFPVAGPLAPPRRLPRRRPWAGLPRPVVVGRPAALGPSRGRRAPPRAPPGLGALSRPRPHPPRLPAARVSPSGFSRPLDHPPARWAPSFPSEPLPPALCPRWWWLGGRVPGSAGAGRGAPPPPVVGGERPGEVRRSRARTGRRVRARRWGKGSAPSRGDGWGRLSGARRGPPGGGRPARGGGPPCVTGRQRRGPRARPRAGTRRSVVRVGAGARRAPRPPPPSQVPSASRRGGLKTPGGVARPPWGRGGRARGESGGPSRLPRTPPSPEGPGWRAAWRAAVTAAAAVGRGLPGGRRVGRGRVRRVRAPLPRPRGRVGTPRAPVGCPHPPWRVGAGCPVV